MDFVNNHLFILIFIIIIVGSFGGYLNYLHNFDTIPDSTISKSKIKSKYIFLGIGASILVPAFLKMIASDLIKKQDNIEEINYLIFSGFCLIASIFSRKFVTSIGEKILEKANNAEKTALESRQQVENTKIQLSSTQDRIDDVKLSINLNSLNTNRVEPNNTKDKILLQKLASTFIERTSIPNYNERIKLKSELGRRMGQIIISNNFNRNDLVEKNPSEGIYLAVAYSVELKPDSEGLILLNKISKLAQQLYTRYVILIAYKTLATTRILNKEDIAEVHRNVLSFKKNADAALLRNIEDTITVLNIIDANLEAE